MDWCTVSVVILIIVISNANCENATHDNNETEICGDAKCNYNLTKFHEQNRFLKLICRDDTMLVVEVEKQSTEEIDSDAYMITVDNQDASKLPPKKFYLIRQPILAITTLLPETSYNISANTLNHHFQYTAQSYFFEFQTLKENYIPGNVTDIYTEDFSLSAAGSGVDVNIWWDPSDDRTCSYNLLFHSTADGNAVFSLREFTYIDELYQFELKQLEFGTQYKVGVEALNTKNSLLKSEIWWHVITTPSCAELLNGNLTLCPPFHPDSVEVSVEYIANNRFNLNVSWEKPKSFPDFYTLQLIDYRSESEQIFNITNGTTNSIVLSDVEINGLDFELLLTAHSIGGNSSTNYYGQINHTITYQPPHADFSTVQIVAFVTVPIFIALVILLAKLILSRHAESVRAVYRNSYFQELDIKSPNDPTIYADQFPTKEQLDQLCALQSEFNFKEDPMELNPMLIQTFEIIGEGAFGCVRRAILLPNKKVVAAKMLKNCLNYSDVRNFYREIEVMKSVPSHPNIVGIVGHCTKNIFELMLLTEYCSEGNLLNFLRNIYDEENRSKLALQMEMTSRFQKDFVEELRKDSAYASPSSSSIDITEHCECGVETSSSRMCIVQNHGYGFDIGNNQVENVITEIDLLSFARQVANGMKFLSVNKVVHRDLACRNVLLLPDRTVKISDFGLSRDIYHDNLYKKCGAGMLPIKWLAIESMTHQVYTTHSDVWSFGILLYEIVTKGSVPYPSVDTNDILNYLKDGGRMDRPDGCRADVYKLMLSCWNAVPTERPTFKFIKDKLTQVMNEMNVTSFH